MNANNESITANSAWAEKLTADNPANILTISTPGEVVIRIAPDGRLFWHEREVETDDDFRAAMLELAKRLVTPWPY